MSRLAALSSWMVWLAMAASAGFWATRLLEPSEPRPVHSSVAKPVAIDGTGWSRLLGPNPPEEAVAMALDRPARRSMKLLGVVAGQGMTGWAVIALDDAPPRVYRVGEALDSGHMLVSVDRRAARVSGSGGFESLLELPATLGMHSTAVHAPAVRAATNAAPHGAAGDDASPIVPPHPEMPTPRTADSMTPDSHWARLREAQVPGQSPSPPEGNPVTGRSNMDGTSAAAGRGRAPGPH